MLARKTELHEPCGTSRIQEKLNRTMWREYEGDVKFS